MRKHADPNARPLARSGLEPVEHRVYAGRIVRGAARADQQLGAVQVRPSLDWSRLIAAASSA